MIKTSTSNNTFTGMKNNYLLALGSAFLLWLAWPPIPYTSVLLLIAFLPLLIAIENILNSNIEKKSKYVFRVSIVTFLIWNTASIYWVFNSLNAVMPTWTAILISFIPFGLAAILMTLATWLYYKMRLNQTPLLSFIALICFWIGYEYLHQTWDLAFPWMTLGNGFASSHQLIQWYQYTGVFGGSLWILISNILVFETYQAFKLSSPDEVKTRYIIGTAIFILLPISISLFIYSTYEEKENPANVIVVQPNIDPYAKYGSMSSSSQVEKLIHLSDSLAQPNTEYFIWPETAIADYTEEKNILNSVHFREIQPFLAKYKNANLISGIESYALYDTDKTPSARFEKDLNMYSDYFNAAIQLENSGKVQFYHKSKLVPGVEQIPFSNALSFLKPVFANFGGSTGGYGKQDEPNVFYSQSGIGAAPVICYESIWGAYVGDYVKKGAQFIAIVTNDAWWGNTSGKDQHLEYAKLRAIETRRWVARSANTGISAFINQRGDIVKQSKWWAATALKQDINLNDELTFYVETGDYIAYLACFGSGIFVIILLFSNMRKQKKVKANVTEVI